MSSHFAKIRKLTIWATTAAPIFYFSAFLCFAYNLDYWVILPFLIAVVLSFGFPLERIPADSQEATRSSIGWLGYIRWAGSMLFIFWIVQLPEFIPLIDRIFTKESLQDWRIILAMLIWLLSQSVSNYLKSLQLQDEEILAIYEEIDPKN